MQAHHPPEFGRDKAPLSGGGCYLFGCGVLTHRAFRLAHSVARAVGYGQGVGLCGPLPQARNEGFGSLLFGSFSFGFAKLSTHGLSGHTP